MLCKNIHRTLKLKYVLIQFLSDWGYFFSLLCLNNILIVFGIFCTLIKYKKANVKNCKIISMVIFNKIRICILRLFGSLVTWWFILYIHRQTIPVQDEGNNFGYITDFFSLVIIVMKRENGTRTRSIYPIKCDEAWNSSVYGDSFSTVTYGWKISRIPYDNLIPPIFILRKKINRHTYEEELSLEAILETTSGDKGELMVDSLVSIRALEIRRKHQLCTFMWWIINSWKKNNFTLKYRIVTRATIGNQPDRRFKSLI